jgi:hypothetical protein
MWGGLGVTVHLSSSTTAPCRCSQDVHCLPAFDGLNMGGETDVYHLCQGNGLCTRNAINADDMIRSHALEPDTKINTARSVPTRPAPLDPWYGIRTSICHLPGPHPQLSMALLPCYHPGSGSKDGIKIQYQERIPRHRLSDSLADRGTTQQYSDSLAV